MEKLCALRTQESCQVEPEKRSVYPTSSYLFANKRTPTLSSMYLSTNKQTVGSKKGLRQSECTRPRIVRHFFPLKRRDGGFFTSGSKEKEYFSVSHFDTKLTGLVIFYWKCLGWPTAEVDAIWRWLVDRGFSIFPRRSRWQGPDHKLPRRAQFFLGHFNILSLLKDSFMFSTLNYLTDVNSCWEYLPKFLSCWPCNDFLWLLDLFLNRTGNWTWQAWKMRWEMLLHLQRNLSVMRVNKKKKNYCSSFKTRWIVKRIGRIYQLGGNILLFSQTRAILQLCCRERNKPFGIYANQNK